MNDIKAKNTMFSVFQRQLDILAHIQKDKGMGSRSEVVRAALTFYHDKLYPDYIFHLSPTAKAKQKDQDRDNLLSEATPEDFAENMSMPIRTAVTGENLVKPGDKVAFTYFAAWTTPVPILLSRLQAFYKEYPGDLEEHLGRVKIEGPIEPLLTEGTRYVSNFGYTCTI